MIKAIRDYIERVGTKRFAVFASVMVTLALVALGSILAVLVTGSQQTKAAEAYLNLSAKAHTGSASIDFDLLMEENSDIRAWLISEGTGIDYPVVQGENNKFYRRHLFSGESNRFGCLYIDAAQSADFSEKNTVIYGGSQLDSIYRYVRQDYYDLLPSMTICTPDKTYTVLLCAGVRTDDIEEAIKTDFADNAEYMNYLSWLKEHSAFHSNISVSEDDSIVTLCASNGKEGFMLVGKLA